MSYQIRAILSQLKHDYKIAAVRAKFSEERQSI